MPWLTFAIAAPLLGSALAPLLPARPTRLPFALAVGATAVSAVALAATWVRFDSGRGMQLVEEATWIPTLDVAWRVGVDGMSLVLALMTVVLFLAAIAYGVGPRPMTRAAAGLLLLLEAATLGFFLAEDFFLFYVAFDVTLVAMYFLIALWGEEERRCAALKFFLYTLIGSLPVLLGIIALFLQSEPQTFDMTRLAAERPLAGVLLKMGTYGLVRVNLQMLPDAFAEYALPVALLGLLSVIYGALVAMAQSDLKRLVAYTSVNHMGYVVIGVAAAAATGISARARELAIDGAVLQMVAHGFVTATLFFIAGFVKERAGTRDLGRLAGLMRPMPWYGSLVALTFFASLGLPGLAQFPAELEIFLGTFDVWPAVASVAVIGIVITAALFLLALQRAFMGEPPQALRRLPDLSRREVVAAAPLVAAGLAVWVWLDRGFVAVMGGIVRVDGLSLTLTALIGVNGALCVALARPA